MKQLIVETSVKEKLTTFLEYLKIRAKDKIHENNGDIIADFVENVLVVELKRLESNPETFEQTIDIPDDVLMEPIMKMKESLDGVFNDFLSGKGITPPPQSGTSSPQTDPQTSPVPLTAKEVTIPKSRNGNGHKKKKVRDLNNSDRSVIDQEFQAVNGEFQDSEKYATNIILPKLPSEIHIWQVTGRISHLHREIASGRLKVGDMDSYMQFLEKHKDLWAQYNSDKYKGYRTKNALNTTPKLSKKKFPQRTV